MTGCRPAPSVGLAGLRPALARRRSGVRSLARQVRHGRILRRVTCCADRDATRNTPGCCWSSRSSSSIHDGYGNYQLEDWIRHANYFIDNVILREARQRGVPIELDGVRGRSRCATAVTRAVPRHPQGQERRWRLGPRLARRRYRIGQRLRDALPHHPVSRRLGGHDDAGHRRPGRRPRRRCRRAPARHAVQVSHEAGRQQGRAGGRRGARLHGGDVPPWCRPAASPARPGNSPGPTACCCSTTTSWTGFGPPCRHQRRPSRGRAGHEAVYRLFT